MSLLTKTLIKSANVASEAKVYTVEAAPVAESLNVILKSFVFATAARVVDNPAVCSVVD